MNMQKIVVWPARLIVSGFLTITALSTHATIPATAIMKTSSTVAPGNFVFKSQYVLDPSGSDPAAAINTKIDAVANAASTRGGVIFLKSGTYTITHPVILHGQGVQLVGLRDETTNQYPTLQYGATFSDSDYDAFSSVRVQQRPAAVRVNGNVYTGTASMDTAMGIYGLNIVYTGTSGTSQGAIATGIAMHRPDVATFRDITITNAHNGIDVGACGHPRFRNVTITGVDGEFGFRAGITPALSNPFKIHGLTVSTKSGNTSAVLLDISANLELIGAKLTGGKIGIRVSGPDWTDAADDVCLRSILIQDTAEQGVIIGNAINLYLVDMQIDRAGSEAIKVLGGVDGSGNYTGLYGGLQIANLRTTYSGLSAIRVQGGMNICLTNTVLLNSGSKNPASTSPDYPVAGISIDAGVTSLNIAGARIGTSTGTAYEQYGIYWATGTSASGPWHTPTVQASNVNFFSNVNTATTRTNRVPLTSTGSYYPLSDAGYFATPPSETWSIQKLASDPQLDGGGWLTQVRGFNQYDLPEIKNQMWIDLTQTDVVTGTAPNYAINSDNFTTLLNEAVTTYPNGVVMYLPAGVWTSTNTYQRRLYSLTKRLLINKPKVQLLGDGRDITQISVAQYTGTANIAPLDNAIKIANTGTNPDSAGIFGLSIYYDAQAAKPTSGKPAGGWGPAVSYAPPFRVDGAQHVRLAGLGTARSMGGGAIIVDSQDVELFDTTFNAAANNTQPAAVNAVYNVVGTSSGSCADIRMYQVFGGFMDNIWIDASGTTAGHWVDDNNADNLTDSQIPELTWVRLAGNVNRVRIDYSTFIEGKAGLVSVTSSGATPTNISTCRLATDHTFCYGVHLINVGTADFYSSWLGGGRHGAMAADNVSGDLRLYLFPARGGCLEGIEILDGNNVSLVNCMVGINYYPRFYQVLENRPKGGIYIGPGVSGATMVGGSSGWLFNADRTSPTTNPNTQDWGVVLGIPSSYFSYYGSDFYGNQLGRIGLQDPDNPTQAVPFLP